METMARDIQRHRPAGVGLRVMVVVLWPPFPGESRVTLFARWLDPAGGMRRSDGASVGTARRASSASSRDQDISKNRERSVRTDNRGWWRASEVDWQKRAVARHSRIQVHATQLIVGPVSRSRHTHAPQHFGDVTGQDLRPAWPVPHGNILCRKR